MPSMFHGMVAAMDGVVDMVNAEAFTFRPMRTVPNAAPVADGDRAVVAVAATFFDIGEEIELAPRRTGAERMQARDSSKPMISVLERLLPRVRQGDRFERAETGKLYHVAGIKPDDAGRLFLTVVEVPA